MENYYIHYSYTEKKIKIKIDIFRIQTGMLKIKTPTILTDYCRSKKKLKTSTMY